MMYCRGMVNTIPDIRSVCKQSWLRAFFGLRVYAFALFFGPSICLRASRLPYSLFSRSYFLARTHTARAGQPDRTATSGREKGTFKKGTERKGQAEQDTLKRTARRGLPDRATLAGLPGQD
jgi:hypothetical protein